MRDPLILPFPFTPDTPLSSAHREYALAKLRHEKARKRLSYDRPETVCELIDSDQNAMDARDRYFRLKIKEERRERTPDEDEPHSWFR